MADDAAATIDDELEVETTEPAPRKRGRPPKITPDPSVKIASDVPNPRYKIFDTNSPNKNQKTSAAWAWWNALPLPMKQIIELNVYRDWPVTLDPSDDSDHKEIGVILGVEPIQTDHDFVDRFGAGDYRGYLNVSPKGEAKRTLLRTYIKCTHAFRDFPPSDRRVDDVSKVDIHDKSNGSYVAWLRATGKLKDGVAKETEDMAATSGVMAELVKDMAQDRRELTQKLLEKNEQDNVIPPEPPQSPQEVIGEQLAIFKSLKELVPTSDPLEMVKQVIGMAQVLTQKDGSANADLKPLMDEISKLREESRATERQMWQSQLADIKERLAAKETTPPTMLASDGASLEGIVQRVVEKFIDKPEPNPWLDVVKGAIPFVGPALNAFAARLMAPAPQPQPPTFPMPPAQLQAGAPQPQAQLPAPAQPQQAAPQPQPQTGAYTTGNPQLDALLMAVVIPLADCLRDGETGAVFADEFIESQGVETHAMLAQVGVEPIANIIAAYPPLAGVIKKITREKLLRFVAEFCEYKPSELPAGGAV